MASPKSLDNGRPKAPRRTHKKSRAGCLQCKSRKVKCDETSPGCGNCKTRGLKCAYGHGPSEQLSADTVGDSGSGLTESSADTPTPSQLLARDDPNMFHLELLHHFTISTCLTLSRNPLKQTLWRVNVIQVGLECPFVMRGILSMAALHLAHFRVEKRAEYIAQAEIHHEAALRTVARELPSIDQSNCTSLWVFTALTCLISCAKKACNPEDSLFSEHNTISEWLQLFRGSLSIIKHYEGELRAGPFGFMFDYRRAGEQPRATTEGPKSHEFLDDLKQLLATTVTDSAVAACYSRAIDQLAESFTVVYGKRECAAADVFFWIFEMSDEYFDLLSAQVPEALAIFAHYIVLMKELEWAWWMKGWSLRLISSVYQTLDGSYRLWIRWPIEQLGWVPT